MKKGTTKAIRLGMRMLKWLEENSDKKQRCSWNSHDFTVDSYSKKRFSVRVVGRLKSHKTATKFKREFPEVGRLKRDNYGNTISFSGNCELVGIPLEVDLIGISELPNNCRLVTKEVWHEEETVTNKAGYIKESKIVCDNGK